MASSAGSFIEITKAKAADASFSKQPLHNIDIDTPQSAPNSISGAGAAWKYCCSALFSGYGLCMVLLIGLLKLGALAIIFQGLSNGVVGDDDSISYSATLSKLHNSQQFQQFYVNRPLRLRKMINDASFRAAEEGALVTLFTQHELMYDVHHIEFVLSTAQRQGSAGNLKDKVSNIEFTEQNFVATVSSSGEVKYAAPSVDPLNVADMEETLIVHRFATGVEGNGGPRYTVVLNKYNTVPDHSLLLSDEFLPQIAPLTATELELLHWIVTVTRSIGFYNSNIIAGASQAHRHMQFVPLDQIWHLRNADAPHALPIEDFIIPKIVSGNWPAFPHHPDPSQGYSHYGAYLHHIEALSTFEHSVAVLLSREAFSAHGADANRLYAEYLKMVYEALLRDNNIVIDQLNVCAGISKSGTPVAARKTSLRGDRGRKQTVSDSSYSASSCSSHSVAYNFLLTDQYMLVVPRSAKCFKDEVDVNSFGFMGLLLASSESQYQLIQEYGPLDVLQGVTWTQAL